MIRPMVLLSLLFAGCTVGEVPLNGAGPDGGGSGDGPGAALCATNPMSTTVGRVTPANAHIHTLGGATNAGQDCMTGCHGAGGTGPLFLMAGTLYKPDGVTPSAGAEIRLTPGAGGNPVIAKTDDAGNFSSSSLTNPFPASTLASACPTTDRPMVGAITSAATANCNGGAACHQVPGGLPMVLADL